MYLAKSAHTQLALKAIENTVNKQSVDDLKLKEVPQELIEQLACFVSIHLNDGSLRGCIGTLQPREKNLYLEIISNAVSASTRDSRFSAIEPVELELLEVSVDVLSKPWLIDDLNELNPKKLGVIVTDGAYSRGVLLPDIEGVNSVKKQLSIAQRKAGLANIDLAILKVYAFTSTRFY